MQEMLFQRPIFKKFPGVHAPKPPSQLGPAVLGSHLRRSHTVLGGGQGKWALWQESLKNALGG